MGQKEAKKPSIWQQKNHLKMRKNILGFKLDWDLQGT